MVPRLSDQERQMKVIRTEVTALWSLRHMHMARRLLRAWLRERKRLTKGL